MRSAAPAQYHVSHPPAAKPLLVFDGSCGFCRLWINRWHGITGDRVAYAASQETADLFPEIPGEAFERSVVLITPEGEAFTGAEAVFRALGTVRSHRLPLWLHESLPGVAPLSEALYGLVARNRPLFSRLTRLLWGSRTERPSYARARCVFLRLMGVVYLAAFVSLWVQVDGLVGDRGILPSAPFLQAVRSNLGSSAFWQVPTLCWLHPGDLSVHLLCGAGTVLSLCLILGVLPAPALVLLWASYLSLTSVCRVFLGFQWDNLLLEAGFLAIFLAPLRLRCRLDCVDAPPRLASWLLRWLLFRLMFSSGYVKLASGDPSWWRLTALDYHYWTQPIPIWTAWYAAKLPEWFQRLSCLVMFVIELAAPFFIFAPRRLRLASFWALVGLQILIAATGNYAFFNLLALAICVLLLDDAAWPARWRRLRPVTSAAPSASSPAGLPTPGSEPASSGHTDSFADSGRARAHDSVSPAPTPSHDSQESVSAPPIPAWPLPEPDSPPFPAPPGGSGDKTRDRRQRWPVWVTGPVAAVVLTLSLVKMDGTLGLRTPLPRLVFMLESAAEPFRSVNSYGLFRVMTKDRIEIVVEGSRDGRTWLPYEFKWKPGDLMRPPPFVAPHQPRLDWQMWFAALGDYRSNPWFMQFLGKLLEGSPEVISLLERNPFSDEPPRFLRALRYDYHFTSYQQGRESGAWWRREPKGLYCPAVTIRPNPPSREESPPDGH